MWMIACQSMNCFVYTNSLNLISLSDLVTIRKRKKLKQPLHQHKNSRRKHQQGGDPHHDPQPPDQRPEPLPPLPPAPPARRNMVLVTEEAACLSAEDKLGGNAASPHTVTLPGNCCSDQGHLTLSPTYPATDDHETFQDHLSFVQPHNNNSVCCLEGGKCCHDQCQRSLEPADDNQSCHFVAVQPEPMQPGSSLPSPHNCVHFSPRPWSGSEIVVGPVSGGGA